MATVFYSNGVCPDEVPRTSIFLAGPTPRRRDHTSWRPEAISFFDGWSAEATLYMPEWDTGEAMSDYDAQIRWEWRHLDLCSVIMFWVPRKLPEFPGFTTNVEFGTYLAKRPDRVIYGRPPDSDKNRYLDELYREATGMTPCDSLEETCRCALVKAKEC